ncbi:hypothetical protein EDE11_111113 [Methylomonas methanica]|uniref:Uncharacterized protein n=1 Tax=Methylomonas methanica TaxID=421 RepID=A0ABY2CPG3_METMH|nr:hypothetical protein EDE11_111113 [Methylomonas methanica]
MTGLSMCFLLELLAQLDRVLGRDSISIGLDGYKIGGGSVFINEEVCDSERR